MKISVVCAFEEEIRLLAEKMESPAQEMLCGVAVTRGTIAGHEVALCIGGIGKANAAATAQFNVSTLGCDLLLNIGLAGNCGALALGEVVVADKLVYHDYDMAWAAEHPPYRTFFTPDAALCEKAKAVLTRLGIRYVCGTVATGDQFIEDSAVKNDIVARTGAACVEMEGAAVAHIAQKCGVPFAVLKVMSDNADEAGHDTFTETVSVGGYCARSSEIVSELIRAL